MTGVNIKTLAKAIAIVASAILGMIALVIVIGHYPFIGMIIIFVPMILCVLGILYQIVMLVYETIEHEKYKQ